MLQYINSKSKNFFRRTQNAKEKILTHQGTIDHILRDPNYNGIINLPLQKKSRQAEIIYDDFKTLIFLMDKTLFKIGNSYENILLKKFFSSKYDNNTLPSFDSDAQISYFNHPYYIIDRLLKNFQKNNWQAIKKHIISRAIIDLVGNPVSSQEFIIFLYLMLIEIAIKIINSNKLQFKRNHLNNNIINLLFMPIFFKKILAHEKISIAYLFCHLSLTETTLQKRILIISPLLAITLKAFSIIEEKKNSLYLITTAKEILSTTNLKIMIIMIKNVLDLHNISDQEMINTVAEPFIRPIYIIGIANQVSLGTYAYQKALKHLLKEDIIKIGKTKVNKQNPIALIIPTHLKKRSTSAMLKYYPHSTYANNIIINIRQDEIKNLYPSNGKKSEKITFSNKSSSKIYCRTLTPTINYCNLFNIASKNFTQKFDNYIAKKLANKNSKSLVHGKTISFINAYFDLAMNNCRYQYKLSTDISLVIISYLVNHYNSSVKNLNKNQLNIANLPLITDLTVSFFKTQRTNHDKPPSSIPPIIAISCDTLD